MMKHGYFLSLLSAIALIAPAAHGQEWAKWEVGGAAGGSFFTSQGVQNGSVSGDASLSPGIVASAWLGNNSGKFLGGEVRYDYEYTNLKLSSNGASTSFAGDTHAIHYDFLFHFAPRGSRVRPYVAAGAGVKMYRGTGKESAYQPLGNLALLSKTTQTTALVSAGGGVKMALTPLLQLRLEVHDYLTPFPKNVITPAQGSKINGWLQNFIVSAGLSATF